MFLEKQTDREFFNDYFKEEQKKENKHCCPKLCKNILSKKSSTKIHEFMRYSIIRAKENMMVDRGLEERKLKDEDIRSIVFDIFSRRKTFTFSLYKRINLYFGFVANMMRTCRCKAFDFNSIINLRRTFKRAKERIEKDCDIVHVMDVTRRYKNFARNFLSSEQKMLLKYDTKNLIDG